MLRVWQEAYAWNTQGRLITLRTEGMSGDLSEMNAFYSFDAPSAEEALTWDADGNLAADGLWTNAWDANNRLIATESRSGVPAAFKKRLTFRYDYMGRRTIKRVESGYSGGAYSVTNMTTYVWDDWQIVSEICERQSPIATNFYTWALDLSGSLRGAGGVGGLAILSLNGTNAFPCHNGNGDVTALVDDNGAIAAEYSYGPFGEALRATGPAAEANPWRFSTRYTDAETGLLLYPKRPYSPTLGRFLSHDPIEEFGGFNLYGFVGNDPVDGVDPLGLEGLQGTGPLYWLVNQLTVPVRVPLGLVGSVLSGDAFSRESPDPLYDSDQCEFLITVTGVRMPSRESQQDFMRQVADLNMFKGIRNPAWVNNPSRIWGLGDAVQILVNETLYGITIPDLRTIRKIEGAADAAKRNGCECWCITVVAHSQGTMLAKRALDVIDPETKKHISIVGLGGETTFGPGDGLAFTKNVAHLNDPVPRKWNKGSFWNGNDTMIPFGVENPTDARAGAAPYETAQGSWFNYDAHSWDKVYIPYLRDHPVGVPRCQPVE